MRVLNKLLVSFVLTLSIIWATSCLSPSSSTGPPEDSHFGQVQISFNDFRPRGTRLSLANEDALNKSDYYSTVRSNAGLKVASDETMNALVETFEDKGFWDVARPGPPPTTAMTALNGTAPLHAVIALQAGSKRGWVTFGKGLPEQELQLFQDCSQAFIATYNKTAAFQLVTNSNGKQIFRKKQ